MTAFSPAAVKRSITQGESRVKFCSGIPAGREFSLSVQFMIAQSYLRTAAGG